MVSQAEQETTVTFVRSDETVHVYSANPKHLRRLRKDSRVTETKGGEDWGDFLIPANQFDPLTGFKRKSKPMTEEQRLAATERLAAARQKKESN